MSTTTTNKTDHTAKIIPYPHPLVHLILIIRPILLDKLPSCLLLSSSTNLQIRQPARLVSHLHKITSTNSPTSTNSFLLARDILLPRLLNLVRWLATAASNRALDSSKRRHTCSWIGWSICSLKHTQRASYDRPLPIMSNERQIYHS